MFGSLIKLVFKSFAEGSGLAEAHADTQKLRSSMVDLGKASMILGGIFGDLGRVAGAGLKTLLTGGMWEIAAQGIQLLIKLTGEWKALSDAAAKAHTEAFKARQAALDKYHAALLQSSKSAQQAIAAEAKAIDKEAESLERAAKAAVELSRQKAIAAGEDADVANEAADWKNADLDQASRRRIAASEVTQADNGVAAAKRNLADANKIYNDLLAEREKAVKAVSERIQGIWASENQFAARNGYRLKKELEADFMKGREDENYNERVKVLADIEDKLAAARAGVAESAKALAEAEKNRSNALRDEQTVAAQIDAEKLKADNERSAAAKAEREKAAEEEAEQARLKMEAEIAAGRALQKLREEEAKQEEEAERKLQEQKEKDRQDALRKEKDANTDRANDLRDKLKKAQEDAAAAFGLFRDPSQIDQAGERRAKRQKDIDQAKLAENAINLQQRKDWRTARLSNRDEATRRWLLAKENEGKVKNEQKEVVDKLDKIKTLLEAATTL